MATRDHKPPVTGGGHRLPFAQLDPRKFEELCLWLVRREGYERAEHLGESGSEQGRDVVAWKGDRRFAFQCKPNLPDGLPPESSKAHQPLAIRHAVRIVQPQDSHRHPRLRREGSNQRSVPGEVLGRSDAATWVAITAPLARALQPAL